VGFGNPISWLKPGKMEMLNTHNKSLKSVHMCMYVCMYVCMYMQQSALLLWMEPQNVKTDKSTYASLSIAVLTLEHHFKCPSGL